MNKFLASMAAVITGVAVFLASRGQTFNRVDIGSATLRMFMAGTGDPAVVFEAGAGSPLEAWVRVQPEVSRFARTISYDRAGNGLSTAGAVPRDGLQIAVDLHTALRNAHVPPPYILAGHSLGGPYIRIFAGMYPDEVAGLVLVDPTQEELLAWAKAREPQPPARELRPYDEVDCAPATFAEAAEHPVPTNIPVFLITGQGPPAVPGFLKGELRKEAEKDEKIYRAPKLKFHREWVEQFPQGRLIVTENSGHGIPYEEPELVVAAIREMVAKARAPSKH